MAACIICLETDPAPIQPGCACRSDAGLAHISCMVEKAKWQHAHRGDAAWHTCQTCEQVFTGAMRTGLADAWCSIVRVEGTERLRSDAAGNRGSALAASGNYTAAEPILRRVHSETRRVYGAEHPDTLTAANNLGMVLVGADKYASAERIFRETLAVQRRVLGDEHHNNLKCASNFAGVLIRLGKPTDAERILRDVISCMKRVLGEEHPSTLTTTGCLILALLEQETPEKLAQAERVGEELRAVQMRVLGPDHPETLNTTYNLASALFMCRKVERAEGLLRALLDAQRRVFGDADPRTSESLGGLLAIARFRLRKGEPTGLKNGRHMKD